MDNDEIIGMEVYFPSIANDDNSSEKSPYHCDWMIARRRWSEMKQKKSYSSFNQDYKRTVR